MPNIIIKKTERKTAEAQTLREFGINPNSANAQQREYAEQITADNRTIKKELKRMIETNGGKK